MKTLKHTKSAVFINSIMLMLIILLIFFYWRSYIFVNIFKSNVSILLWSLILIYVLVFLLTFVLMRLSTFKVTKNFIIKETNFILFKKRKYIKLDPNTIVVKEFSGLYLRLFYQAKLSIFIYGKKKLFSIFLAKDDAKQIEDIIFNLKEEKKKHFIKDEDFFFTKDNFFSLIFHSLYIVLIVFSLYSVLIFLIDKNVEAFILFGALVFFIFEVIYVIFEYLHTKNTKITTREKTLKISVGNIISSECFFKREAVDRYFVETIPFIKRMNSFTSILGLSEINSYIFPSHKDGIDLDTKHSFDRCFKYYHLLKLPFTISIIMSTLISIGISFISIEAGIILLLILILISFIKGFNRGLITSENKIILKSGFFFSKYTIYNENVVKKIDLKKVLKNYYVVTLHSEQSKKKVLIDNEEATLLKNAYK